MTAILDLCKLGSMEGSDAEMIVFSAFLDPENTGVDTKMKLIRVSHDEIQVKIGSNGGHFGFMQIRYEEKVLYLNECYQCIPGP